MSFDLSKKVQKIIISIVLIQQYVTKLQHQSGLINFFKCLNILNNRFCKVNTSSRIFWRQRGMAQTQPATDVLPNLPNLYHSQWPSPHATCFRFRPLTHHRQMSKIFFRRKYFTLSWKIFRTNFIVSQQLATGSKHHRLLQ